MLKVKEKKETLERNEGVALKFMPNILSMGRLIGVLTLLLMHTQGWLFWLGYILCGLSDVLDGLIARRLNATSRLGEKLDSLADLALTVLVLAMIFASVPWRSPEVLWVLLIALTRMAAILVAARKFHTFASLHTYGNKATGLALFAVPLVMFFTSNPLLLYVAGVLASLSAMEELLIQLTSNTLHVNRKSIFSKADV